MAKIYGYLRVSTDKQDLNNQRLSILDYARKNKLHIHKFFKVIISSRRARKERKIDEILQILKAGDTLIVSELSRIGRSLGQIVQIVDTFIKKQIKFIALKQGIFIDGKQTIQTKVTVGLFAIFSDIEQDLISQRTSQGLMAAKLRGRLIGRPKGAMGKSKLDGKEEQIIELIQKNVPKSSIAKIFGVSRPCLYNFIKSRDIRVDKKKIKIL